MMNSFPARRNPQLHSIAALRNQMADVHITGPSTDFQMTGPFGKWDALSPIAAQLVKFPPLDRQSVNPIDGPIPT